VTREVNDSANKNQAGGEQDTAAQKDSHDLIHALILP
jgi:hypothetical protein